MFDGDSYHYFGTPLPAIQKDEVPSKKPVRAEDQIVTDENGRRRFHGAFTGGFSAGFWNTVGSKDGWTPQNFKSSRKEKAPQSLEQRPEDFMDDEDLGEFGIAPQRVQPRSEFATDQEDNRKRKFAPPSIGPIPGVPVLQQLLAPRNDKVAERILKSMGWRPGQGVGPRQTRKEKKQARARNKREFYVMKQYGCEIDGKTLGDSDESSGTSESEDNDGITFAPDDIEPYFLRKVKDDRFGLGYTGLSRDLVLSKGEVKETQHINLFGPLEVLDKNKKLSISGQAFGVGALEEDDDDIYAKDDMTKYDFSLARKKAAKKAEHIQDKAIIDGFVEAKEKPLYHEPFTVDMPPDFQPRNWALRRSRFAPLDPQKAKELEKQFKHIDLKLRQVTTPGTELYDEQPSTSARAKEQQAQNLKNMSLQEIQDMYKSREDKAKALLERISAKSSGFTKGGIISEDGQEKPNAEGITAEQQDLLEKAKNKTKELGGDVASGVFKPFMGDTAKQQRYEEFIAKNLQDDKEINDFLATLQPVHFSEWDREMEKKEFIQARKLYKPLGGIMSDRFVTESTIHAEKQKTEREKDSSKKINMERTKTIWKPSSLLCKRYNIAEPFGGHMVENKKPNKPRMSVFDYLETSVNKKDTFQTPVIIPKHIEKPKQIIKASDHLPKQSEPAPEPQTPTKDTVLPSKESAKKPHNQFVPKTELEKRVVESQHKPAHEKFELFKAIFDDSDEDEQKDSSEVKEPIEPTKPKTNSAAVANLLRNTSPPRGIFAALFTLDDKTTKANEPDPPKQPLQTAAPIAEAKKDVEKISKITFKPRSERSAAFDRESAPEAHEEVGTEVYGPKIPDHLLADKTSRAHEVKPPAVDTALDLKLLELWQKHKEVMNVGQAEQWVEKRKSGESSSSSDDSSSSSDHKSHKKSLKNKKRKRGRDKKLRKKKSKTKWKKHGKEKKHKKNK